MDENNNNNNNNENEIPTENKEVTENNNGQQKEEKPTDQYYQSYQSYQSYSVNQQNTYSNENQNVNQNQNPDGYYYSQQTQNTQYGYDPMTNPPQPKKKDSFGIASFCLSLGFILLFMCCCCCAPFAGVFLFLIVASEVMAIVLAIMSKKKMGRFTGLAIAGLVISIIVLFIIIAIVVSIVAVYTSNPEYYDDLLKCFSEPGYYKEFFAKHEPEFYNENKAEIDEYFKNIFEQSGISVDID